MAMAFIDLQAQRDRIADRVNEAVLKVVAGGQYIFGPEVRSLETSLAAFSGARHALGVGNGTDAIVIALRALGVGPGDAVFCPSFTFTATAEAVVLVGATPVFVDIDAETYNIAPDALAAAIAGEQQAGQRRTAAVIAVDLFGEPADYPALRAVCDAHGLRLIADSAQGFGCTIDGRHPSDWADLVTTSFFPAKPLGCYGDGGAVLTNDPALAELVNSIRVHGKVIESDLAGGTFAHDPKYLNFRIGTNSRLDTIQAAILLEKLAIFPDEIVARNRIAARYNAALAGHVVKLPVISPGKVSTWAQYTIEVNDRDGLAAHLKARGIPSGVYYPIPMHLQPAYEHQPRGTGGLPVTEGKSARVLSLPMHPYLSEADQDQVVAAIREFVPVGELAGA